MFDTLPFETAWKTLYGDSIYGRSVAAFVRFMEKKLGAHFVYDGGTIPFGHPELLDLFELAEKMKAGGIIKNYNKRHRLPDEPQFFQWSASYGSGNDRSAGGISVESDRSALTATLAEALERYLWFEAVDFFRAPLRATTEKISRRGRAIAPERFAGFSAIQRAKNKRLTLSPDAEYLWIRGSSLVDSHDVWIPAQVISGKHGGANFRKDAAEPVIISPITTGLATGPTREFALLNGALEIIERDAFMITWLNQLSPPRIDLAQARAHSETLAKLLDSCARYRLHVEALHLPTDAPASVVCVVVEDTTEVGPPLMIGLKAHRNISKAIEGALLEALRMRQNARSQSPFDAAKKKEDIAHMERISYWADAERAQKLGFLTQGKTEYYQSGIWENDNIAQHLEHITKWCAEVGYECTTISLGTSSKNVTPWYVEMVVIPELIPIHQNERYQYTSGDRIREIPAQFGYTPRAEPYLDEPHPFA